MQFINVINLLRYRITHLVPCHGSTAQISVIPQESQMMIGFKRLGALSRWCFSICCSPITDFGSSSGIYAVANPSMTQSRQIYGPAATTAKSRLWEQPPEVRSSNFTFGIADGVRHRLQGDDREVSGESPMAKVKFEDLTFIERITH